MKQIRLGKSELMVSQVGFGGIPITRVSDAEAAKCIHTAMDLGVNFIDTATGYRDSEEKIGKALKGGKRDEVILATKAPPTDAKTMKEKLELSLQRLQTDTIDLYQYHLIRDEASLKQSLDILPMLEQARDEGKIRHIGATVHGVEWINSILDVEAFETVMIALNFIVREAAEVALPKAQANDIGVIAMKPMAGGQIEEAYLAFKWFMDYPDIVPLVGIQTPEEIREIVEIVERGETATEAERAEMDRIRAEMGDKFCRRCEYCMPCPHGVKIVPMTILNTFTRRMPEKAVVQSGMGKNVDSVEQCVQCGECMKKCPYDLDIVTLIHENAAYFNELRAQYGEA